MKIISVVAARPNFMKIAPFIDAINIHNSTNITRIDHILVHTGQHYDDRMSEAFFEDLNIPKAQINLGIGSGSHAEQVGKTMIEFEKVLIEQVPDWVVVVGDVNATLACSVTAKKLNIKCCHIEAGLRSGDMTMPEEINRLVTDRVSDLLLTPDKISIDNLIKEGVDQKNIKFVGNIMIDTLEKNKHRASSLQLNEIIKVNSFMGIKTINLVPENYAVVTMHRPSNVDNQVIFEALINFFVDGVCNNMSIVWPIHPRAEKQLKAFGLWDKISTAKNIVLTRPLGYLEMLRLNMSAKIMLTDSGGLQEECTVLGTPCLTLRWNTERPITLKENGGASILVGNNIEKIRVEYQKILGDKRNPRIPELWDGKTAGRIVKEIISYGHL